MNEKQKVEIKAWIQKANHDILAIDRLVSIEPVLLDGACFHCQQAVEKFLKAYLISEDQNVGRTHNIDFLMKECGKFNSVFHQIDVKDISVYAVKARYPSNFINPEMVEVEFYYSLALEIKKLVESLISI